VSIVTRESGGKTCGCSCWKCTYLSAGSGPDVGQEKDLFQDSKAFK